mmetsp:Transcript_3779/g.9374  ORF Transcript_3779/g.9374 Transcript_3779/m.9374 type:complete len:225 (+) Transcript_3779:235-909(+)
MRQLGVVRDARTTAAIEQCNNLALRVKQLPPPTHDGGNSLHSIRLRQVLRHDKQIAEVIDGIIVADFHLFNGASLLRPLDNLQNTIRVQRPLAPVEEEQRADFLAALGQPRLLFQVLLALVGRHRPVRCIGAGRDAVEICMWRFALFLCRAPHRRADCKSLVVRVQSHMKHSDQFPAHIVLATLTNEHPRPIGLGCLAVDALLRVSRSKGLSLVQCSAQGRSRA